ncbi:hypothetical protein Tco_0746541 [Tanacetum coccineum]
MDVDDHEIIHPYNEMDPLNRPPPDFDSEPEEAVAPVGRSTLQFLLLSPGFSGTVYVGEGHPLLLSMPTIVKMKDYVEVEFSTLKMLANGDRHMNLFDDDWSKLDSALREEIQSHIKIEQLVVKLGKQVQEMKESDVRAENKNLKTMLKTAEESVEYHCLLPPHHAYQAWRHQVSCTNVLVILVAHDDPNDLYVAVCNATTVIVIDDDGSATLGDPQPSELRGSPPLAVDHAARNPAGGSRGNLGEIGGQGGAPPARECSFAIYKKCNPTSFHRNKGAVELYRWFEMTEITTLGLETANRKPWTEMKRMVTEEFCPAEEI